MVNVDFAEFTPADNRPLVAMLPVLHTKHLLIDPAFF